MKQSEHLKILQKLERKYKRLLEKEKDEAFNRGWDGAMAMRKITEKKK